MPSYARGEKRVWQLRAETEHAGFTLLLFPPESDLDDEQILNMLASRLYSEKQVPTDHEFITLSEKTQCPVHLVSEQVWGDLQLCSHTKESRFKNLTPTDTVFPWHIEQLKETMN